MAGQAVIRGILCAVVAVCALLLGQMAYDPPIAYSAQLMQSEEVYALPGTLERASSESFVTYFVTSSGTRYAIFGATPAVEDEIARIRDGVPGTMVQVWGVLSIEGQQTSGREIIASAVQEASGEAATATPQPTATPISTAAPPVAIGRFEFVNLHEGSNLDSPVVGQIVLGQRCPVTGRNPNASAVRILCDGIEGWVASTVVTLEGDLSQIAVVGGVTATNQIPIVVVEQSLATPVPSGDYWLATYYANRGLQGNPVLVQEVPRIEFDWGAASPGPLVPVDNFSAIFERTIEFPAGQYRLCVCNLDDGARMWIDDELVLNDWTVGAARDLVVDRQLAGARQIRIEYFEATENASITFTYQDISVPREVWRANYWNNTALEGPAVMTREEPRSTSAFALDYDWGTGSPAPGVVNADLFSARWQGVFTFAAGSYVFSAYADDGVRIYVDGTLVLYGWNDGYRELTSGIYSIGPGQHQVLVEYYERTGDALIRLRWYQDQPMLAR